jgi:hypothetical protein
VRNGQFVLELLANSWNEFDTISNDECEPDTSSDQASAASSSTAVAGSSAAAKPNLSAYAEGLTYSGDHTMEERRRLTAGYQLTRQCGTCYDQKTLDQYPPHAGSSHKKLMGLFGKDGTTVIENQGEKLGEQKLGDAQVSYLVTWGGKKQSLTEAVVLWYFPTLVDDVFERIKVRRWKAACAAEKWV